MLPQRLSRNFIYAVAAHYAIATSFHTGKRVQLFDQNISWKPHITKMAMKIARVIGVLNK